MAIEKITNLSDPRLLPYADIRNKQHFRSTGNFIAEGWRVVERLLDSSLTVHSVLVSERREQTMVPRFAERAAVLVVPEELAQQLVGYNFHAGVLASAQSPDNPPLAMLYEPREAEEPPKEEPHAAEKPEGKPQTGQQRQPLILCCPHLTGPDNLGSLIRLAAGFGVSGVLLGGGSVEPYLRRCVRVSMGTIFRLPVRVTAHLAEEIQFLKSAQQFEILAAEKTAESLPLQQRSTEPSRRAAGCLLMLGNEAEGLAENWLALADQVYHIPMSTGVDSLNIASAAGIFLYELTRFR